MYHITCLIFAQCMEETSRRSMLGRHQFCYQDRINNLSEISLKHEWKRESGSEHDQRPEARQLFRRFQSSKPTLNQFRERSGRPDITHAMIGVQDERKRPVLRTSMLILFAQNAQILVLQSERCDPFMRRV